MILKKHIFLLILFVISFEVQASDIRKSISLNSNWKTVADDHDIDKHKGFEIDSFDDNKWLNVNVPHNWDRYEGYRRLLHGNRHGYAWYRKKFKVTENAKNKRFFLFFEGVGSYATVWLNGKEVGYHAGGRTTFTIDVTDAIKAGSQENILAVRADHPAEIR
ncbi:glycoside hydrolase family 2, partial [Pseudoxanthomonas sp. SGD-10]